MMASNDHCANCGRDLEFVDELGESQLYSPDRGYDLCVYCWLEEERLIEERGTNDWPERLEHYKYMVSQP